MSDSSPARHTVSVDDAPDRVERRSIVVDAAAATIFDVLATPSRHHEFDGSGSVQASRESAPERLSEGAKFGMDMKIVVPYRMTNEVVEFVENETIAWRHFGGHIWRYQLDDVEGGTKITEEFDWRTSKAPPFLKLMGYPAKNAASIEKTLERLAALVDDDTASLTAGAHRRRAACPLTLDHPDTLERMASTWLNDREMAAWRSYIETYGDLSAALERDLAEHGLTLGDYQVLVYLSEADDGSMRMCDLADVLQLSPSGLTRRLDGLVSSDHVMRRPSPHDGRVMMAVLTDAGNDLLTRTAPHHVDSVRRHIFDHLNADQVDAMAAIFDAISAGLAAAETSTSDVA